MDCDGAASSFINHLAGADRKVLAWLEREGLDYDMAAAEQLQWEPNLLAPYKAVLLNTYCEYWSREMFSELERGH